MRQCGETKRLRSNEESPEGKVVATPPGKDIKVAVCSFSEARLKTKPPSWPMKKRKRDPEAGNEDSEPGMEGNRQKRGDLDDEKV